MTQDEKVALAKQFLSVLSAPNEDVIRKVAVEDMIWAFPGSSVISGEAHGVAGIMTRAHAISGHHVRVEVLGTLFGLTRLAVLLHNTASADGHVLDEQVAAVFTFRGDKIERLDTLLSDVPMAEAFFGKAVRTTLPP